MKRIKICEVCKVENSPADLFCANCGTDISRVCVVFTDESKCKEDNHIEYTEATTKDYDADIPYNENTEFYTYFKLCYNCGKISTADCTICDGCDEELGYDIIESDQIPMFLQQKILNGQTFSKSMMIEKDGQMIREVCLSNGLAGFGRSMINIRSDKNEERKYISELHFLVVENDDGLQVFDISTNGTYIGDTPIPKPYSLKTGDTLGICYNNIFKISFGDKEV